MQSERFADPECSIELWQRSEVLDVLLRRTTGACDLETVEAYEALPYEGTRYRVSARAVCEPDGATSAWVTGRQRPLTETLSAMTLQTE